jgi:hypothetical protein
LEKIPIVKKIAAPWLFALLIAWPGHAEEWTVGIDRSRAGEKLLEREALLLNECARPLETVVVERLSTVEISAIGRVFGIPPAAVRKFRRGTSLAPQGHLLREALWYTIWYEAYPGSGGAGRLTLRVEPGGRTIIEEKHW